MIFLKILLLFFPVLTSRYLLLVESEAINFCVFIFTKLY